MMIIYAKIIQTKHHLPKLVGHNCSCWPNGETALFFQTLLPAGHRKSHPKCKYRWSKVHCHDLTPPVMYAPSNSPSDLCHLLHIKAKLLDQPVHKLNASTMYSKVQQCPFILNTSNKAQVKGHTSCASVQNKWKTLLIFRKSHLYFWMRCFTIARWPQLAAWVRALQDWS